MPLFLQLSLGFRVTVLEFYLYKTISLWFLYLKEYLAGYDHHPWFILYLLMYFKYLEDLLSWLITLAIIVKNCQARLMHLPLIGDLIFFFSFWLAALRSFFSFWKSKFNKSNFTKICLMVDHSGSVSLSHQLLLCPFTKYIYVFLYAGKCSWMMSSGICFILLSF